MVFTVGIPGADPRDLHDAIHGFRDGSLYWHLLWPWAQAHPDERARLLAFATRSGNPIPPASHEDLWHLYALSRVNQVLLLRFQQGRADGTDWPGPELSPNEYRAFSESLGMAVADVSEFHPFYHEIVEVHPGEDPDEPLTLVGEFWPCLMLGDMLFSRAGVCVTGGSRSVNKEVAESSTLYWAYRRKNRSHEDQSHGWGSNSQWATAFRRDYRIGSHFYFNADGEHDLTRPIEPAPEQPELTQAERIELLTNRCFLTTTKPHDDLYPYDDTHRTTL